MKLVVSLSVRHYLSSPQGRLPGWSGHWIRNGRLKCKTIVSSLLERRFVVADAEAGRLIHGHVFDVVDCEFRRYPMPSALNSFAAAAVLAGVTTIVVSDFSKVVPIDVVDEVIETDPVIDFAPPGQSSESSSATLAIGRAAPWSSFQEMHDVYTQAFVDSDGFGMRRIATFSEPQHRLLFVSSEPHAVIGMQMIGLMNGASVAYKSNWINVTRESLKHLEQRALTEFENSALTSLEGGKPYVWAPGTADGKEQPGSGSQSVFGEKTDLLKPDSGRLLAGLRATSACVQCHDVDEGTLLGAFIYELRPIPRPVPVPTVGGLMSTPSPIR